MRLKLVQEPYEMLRFLAVFSTRVWLSSLKLSLFVKLGPILVNTHSCITAVQCELFIFRLLVCLHTWLCSLCNFYSILFSGSERLMTAVKKAQLKIKRIHREDEDKVKNSI